MVGCCLYTSDKGVTWLFFFISARGRCMLVLCEGGQANLVPSPLTTPVSPPAGLREQEEDQSYILSGENAKNGRDWVLTSGRVDMAVSANKHMSLEARIPFSIFFRLTNASDNYHSNLRPSRLLFFGALFVRTGNRGKGPGQDILVCCSCVHS